MKEEIYCELCLFPREKGKECEGCKLLEEFFPNPKQEKEDQRRCKCGTYIKLIDDEFVCTKCARHYGYTYTRDCEIAVNYNKTRQRYNIKYYLETKLKKFKLQDQDKGFLENMFRAVLFAYRKCNTGRKALINLDFILVKLFRLLQIPEKEKMCKPIKTKSTRKKYETLWKQICEINKWEYHSD